MILTTLKRGSKRYIQTLPPPSSGMRFWVDSMAATKSRGRLLLLQQVSSNG